MLRLIGKEMKITIRSIPFLFCVILIVAMYWTQCLPKKWIYYAPPMDEMHLYYSVMKTDYQNGYTQEFYEIPKVVLNDNMKKKLKETILLMNPKASENEEIDKITFHISEKEYMSAMDALNMALGGWSYYVSHYHNDFYSVYCSNALGSKMATTKEEMIECMENHIEIISKIGKYEVYSELISKNVALTDKEKSYITDIYIKMKAEKQKELNINKLYEKYNALYMNIDKMIGGNTSFGTKYRFYIYQVTNNLEDSINNFQSLRDNDKITNAYARNYSDYFSILAGFLPVVIGAFALIEERRWKMHELIYSRAIRSKEYVLAKFGAIIFLFMLCFYALGAISTFLFAKFGLQYHLTIDYFAFFKYITFWVMPTLLFTTAFSMFISVIVKNGVVPIMLQIFVFFLSTKEFIGDYQLWKPIIRYNEIGMYDFYQKNLSNIILNRCFITFVSVLLIIGTTLIYSNLRKEGNILICSTLKCADGR